MKNYTSYTNDYDIPKKKDVDAKQGKITAEGVLVGDGAGNIEGKEIQEVELVELAAVATSGSYNDLSDKPTIPTVPTIGNATITIKQGSTTKGRFTTNQSADGTITLDAAPVTSVNGKTGVVSLAASDVGAMPSITVSASDNGKFLRVVNGAWDAATVANANGVSF